MNAIVYDNPKGKKKSPAKKRSSAKKSTGKKAATKKQTTLTFSQVKQLMGGKKSAARAKGKVRRNPVSNPALEAAAGIGGGAAVVLVGSRIAKMAKQENTSMGAIIMAVLGALLLFFGIRQKNNYLQAAGTGGITVGGLLTLNRLMMKAGTTIGPFSPVLSGTSRLAGVKSVGENYLVLNQPGSVSGVRRDDERRIGLGRSEQRLVNKGIFQSSAA